MNNKNTWRVIGERNQEKLLIKWKITTVSNPYASEPNEISAKAIPRFEMLKNRRD